MPCDYRCSHPDCIEEHDLARSLCSLGCGDPIGYDAHVGYPPGSDEPAHLDCVAALDDEELPPGVTERADDWELVLWPG